MPPRDNTARWATRRARYGPTGHAPTAYGMRGLRSAPAVGMHAAATYGNPASRYSAVRFSGPEPVPVDPSVFVNQALTWLLTNWPNHVKTWIVSTWPDHNDLYAS